MKTRTGPKRWIYSQLIKPNLSSAEQGTSMQAYRQPGLNPAQSNPTILSHWSYLMLRSIIAVSFIFFFTSDVPADIAPLSREKLEERSSHQITGQVKRVYMAREVEKQDFGPYEYTYYVVEVAVTSVGKGAGIRKGDMAYIRCNRIKWIGVGLPPPGHSGHTTVPAKGDTIAAYLRQNKDRGYDILLPNGCTILARNSQP
jgi:hypothetical protein